MSARSRVARRLRELANRMDPAESPSARASEVYQRMLREAATALRLPGNPSWNDALRRMLVLVDYGAPFDSFIDANPLHIPDGSGPEYR